MQVFKLFFKILKANRILIFIYAGMYIGILFGVIIPLQKDNSVSSYMEQKCKFALVDEDNSTLSHELTRNLSSVHELVDIKSFEKEALQDELYNQNIATAVFISDGFEDAFIEGDATDFLTLYNVPTENKAMLFSNDVNEYLRYVSGYLTAGYDLDEACNKAFDITAESVDVSVLSGKDISQESIIQYYFKYLGWIFVLMITCVIAPILIALNTKKLRNRIECSSFHFSKINSQILLGSAVSGIGLVAIFSIAAKIYFGAELSGVKFALMSLNMLCYVVVALAIAFFVSRITSSIMVINMVANVISLGMAFFCGIFVPFYLLGSGVQTVAKFMPAYWYVNAINEIDKYSDNALPNIFQSFGLELLFAAVIIVAALVITNAKRESKTVN